MSTEAPLVLDVERLTFGPDALAHHERQVVFVGHAAPGDRVTARVVERRGGYLRAEVETVVAPGPDRVLPGCPWFPTCGGCQWQQVAPAAQRAAKAAVLAEQLARIGGLRDVPVAAPLAAEAWGYRARIALMVEGRVVGYHRARSHRLVEVDGCPIAEPAVAAHVAAARRLVGTVRVPLARLAIVAAPDGVVLVGTGPHAPGPADRAAAEALQLQTASVRGVVLAGAGTRVVSGDPTVAVALEPGLRLEVPADVFTQVNPSANRLLVAHVMGRAALRAGDRVLDLYCGAGNFALPAARRGATVLGVERDPLAVTAAQENAARLVLPSARFVCAAVGAALRTQVAPVDVVILDPPRAGAADVLPALAALRAPRMLYVSCDPATLARDVRVLVAHGYRIAHVQPVDVFPQTYHIESVTDLHLT